MKKNTLLIIGIVFLLFITIIGCNRDIKVLSVSLDYDNFSLIIGDTVTLAATVFPEDATDKSVYWMSSNPTIATVDNGFITAKKVGTTTISVTTTDGNFVAECAVKVNPVINVTGVTLNHENLKLAIRVTYPLTATVFPVDATNQTLNWESSNPAVADVDDGIITAKDIVGTTTIKVITNDGNYTASCDLLVELGWVEINGVKWAISNVDAPGTFAANPNDPGMFYQWNRRVGWSLFKPLVNSDGGTEWDSSIPDSNRWRKVNDPSPTGWRLPIYEELLSLSDSENKSDFFNAVPGIFFFDNDKRVFFPYTGYRNPNGVHLYNEFYSGALWSSTQYRNSFHPDAQDVFCMFILYGNGLHLQRVEGNLGLSVRCVLDE